MFGNKSELLRTLKLELVVSTKAPAEGPWIKSAQLMPNSVSLLVLNSVILTFI